MDTITLLGLTAGFLTTIASLPQIIKTWRTKEAKDLSLWSYIVVWVGVLLWIIYGIIIKDTPLIAANIVSFIFVSVLLVFKIKY